MRIGIDFNKVGGFYQGAKTYLVNLVKGLSQIDPRNEYILYTSRVDDEIFNDLPGNFTVKLVWPNNPFARIPLVMPYLSLKDSLDILHSQNICPPAGFCRNVVTIHDILFEDYPEYFSNAEVMKLKVLIRHSARIADGILTVSGYCRDRIRAVYGVNENKIMVSRLSVDEKIRTSARGNKTEARSRLAEKYCIPVDKDYYLFVGRLNQRKNIHGMIKAFQKLKAMGVKDKMIVVSGNDSGDEKNIRQLIQGLSIEHEVHLTGMVAQEDMVDLYKGSCCFVYPSFAEGFGLPVMEAMSCGIPVVTSNSTCFPEIYGDAALYADPHDVDAIAARIYEVVINDEINAQLVTKGLQKVREYSWRETALRTLEMYDKVFPMTAKN